MIWLTLAVGGALALFCVIGMAARRRIVALLGFSYSRQRPRWTVLIVAGLTVGTAVIAAAGIGADSASESYLRSAAEQSGRVAGALDGRNARLGLDVSGAARVVAHPDLAPLVTAHTATLRLEREVGATILSGKQMAIWGIEPTSYARVTYWQAVEGQLPDTLEGWARDAFVLNEEAAIALGLFVGDPVHLILDRTPGVRVLNERENQEFDGNFQAVLYNPLLFQYVHSPNNQNEFTFTVEPWAGADVTLYVNATAAGEIDLHLELLGPGDISEWDVSPGPEARAAWFLPAAGEWRVVLHSPLAADVDLHLNVEFVRPRVEVVPRLEVHSGRVQAIVPTAGSDPVSPGPVVFLPLPVVQDIGPRDASVNVILVAARDEVEPKLLMTALENANSAIWGGMARVIVPLADGRAEVVRAEMERLLLAFATFTLIGGVLLVFVIMTLLVEDRKRTIAVMRAVGGQRSDVTQLLVSEGTVYAMLAVLAGIPLGLTLVLAMSGPLTSFAADGGRLALSIRPVTLAGALGGGFLFVIGSVFLSARRVGRLEIPEALRGEEPDRPRRTWMGMIRAGSLAAAGVLTALVGFAGGWPAVTFIGAILLILGSSQVLSCGLGRPPFVIATAAVVLVAGLLFLPLVDLNDQDAALLLPFVTLVMALSGSVLLVHARSVHRIVVWAAARARLGPAIVEGALSHVRARPGRSSLVMGILATAVLITTVFAGIWGALESPSLGDAGGFDVLGYTHARIEDPYAHLAMYPPRAGFDPAALAHTIVATPWLEHSVFAPASTVAGTGGTELRSFDRAARDDVIGVTPALVDEARFQNSQLAPGYRSVLDAFRAVLQNPGLVVVADHMRLAQDGSADAKDTKALSPGDRLVLRAHPDFGGPERELQVIGVLQASGAAGFYVHPNVVLASGFEAGTLLWARPLPGVSPETLAAEIEGGYRSVALEAVRIADPFPAERIQARNIQILLGIYLGFGILVGVIGLGLLTLRSVVVRRREIGVLRALGATPGLVSTMFAFEGLYVTIGALLVGVAGAALVAEALLADLPGLVIWRLDWDVLGPFYAATILAAGLMAGIAARHAARMDPARALRHYE